MTPAHRTDDTAPAGSARSSAAVHKKAAKVKTSRMALGKNIALSNTAKAHSQIRNFSNPGKPRHAKGRRASSAGSREKIADPQDEIGKGERGDAVVGAKGAQLAVAVRGGFAEDLKDIFIQI